MIVDGRESGLQPEDCVKLEFIKASGRGDFFGSGGVNTLYGGDATASM